MMAPGTTVSRYRIVAEISRGGMGIVYRALDTTLNREVALKILPPDLVADADRRARFLQEAQAASALEHPHIAVIHEVGEAGGVHFIAMELNVRSHYFLGVLADKRGDRAKAKEYFGKFAAFWKDGDLDRDRVKEAEQKAR